MGLFGTFTFNEKKAKSETLVEMAEKIFGEDSKLMEEIKNYLISRRQQRNYPSRISWKMQLDILKEIPENERINQVRNCTIKGYRQIAYKKNTNIYNNYTNKDVAAKREKGDINIVNQAF